LISITISIFIVSLSLSSAHFERKEGGWSGQWQVSEPAKEDHKLIYENEKFSLFHIRTRRELVHCALKRAIEEKYRKAQLKDHYGRRDIYEISLCCALSFRSI
jgi:hypothetical protein